MSAKEIKPGVTRVTFDLPTELYRRLMAYAKAQSTPYAKVTMTHAARRLLHDGLSQAGSPTVEDKPKGKRPGRKS